MDHESIGQSFYICVYIPDFSTQSIMRFRPELIQSPLAVVSGQPPFEQVCSMNSHAAKLGVTGGMGRSEIECFTTLRTIRRSEHQELIARSRLLEAAGAFTPQAKVLPPLGSAFMIALDMTGTDLLFGSRQQTINKIIHSVAAEGFYAQFATSSNLCAAICFAPWAREAPMFLTPGQEAKYLRTLPVSTLNLTPEQSEMFSLWGLNTLGELADVNETDIVVRLGQEGKRLRLMARGEYSQLFVPEEPIFTLRHFVSLDTPVELMDSLLFTLSSILGHLMARAATRSLALASVTIELSLDGGAKHKTTIRPALPIVQLDNLLKLINLDLLAHPPLAGVTGILVYAEPGHRSKVQIELLYKQVPEPAKMDVTLARVSAIVGEERVGSPKLKDTRRPDNFSMIRFTIPAKNATYKRLRKATMSLRRYRPSMSIAVQQEGSRPIALVVRGNRYQVKQTFGPWRKSGDWWSTNIWSHEEWDVHAVSDSGDTMLCLLTHDLLNHLWKLEALYD